MSKFRKAISFCEQVFCGRLSSTIITPADPVLFAPARRIQYVNERQSAEFQYKVYVVMPLAKMIQICLDRRINVQSNILLHKVRTTSIKYPRCMNRTSCAPLMTTHANTPFSLDSGATL